MCCKLATGNMRFRCFAIPLYFNCICLVVMCKLAFVVLFRAYFCARRSSVYRFSYCSDPRTRGSKRQPVVKFMHLKTVVKTSLTGIDYVVVIPSSQKIPLFFSNNYPLQQLISVLVSTKWLEVVTGWSSIVPMPFCTVIRQNWTLYLNKTYANFYNNSQTIVSTEAGICYPCNLLPEPIIIRASTLKAFINMANYTALGDQAIVYMQINLQGKMAYCPSITIRSVGIGITKPYGCADRLGSMWDHKFSEFAKITGIYRLRLPNNMDAWLWCVFHFKYVNLPISCAEWNYEYILGMDALMARAKYEYVFVFGTALGAVRDRDIIPWTADVDIVLNVSVDYYQKTLLTGGWNAMEKNSYYNFSIEARDGSRHDNILRLFPRCPMILTKQYNLGPAEEAQIGEAIKAQPVVKGWQQPPYIDVYHNKYAGLRGPSIFDRPEKYDIRNASVMMVSDVEEHLLFYYGPFWKDKQYSKQTFTKTHQ